jgi:hypothetical protein
LATLLGLAIGGFSPPLQKHRRALQDYLLLLTIGRKVPYAMAIPEVAVDWFTEYRGQTTKIGTMLLPLIAFQ